MLKNFQSQAKKILAVELSAALIKAVVMSKHADHYLISAWSSVKLAPGIITEKPPSLLDSSALAAKLSELSQKIAIPTKLVALLLADRCVSLSYLKFPQLLSPYELALRLELEAKLGERELYYDYQLLSNKPSQDGLEVVWAGADKIYLQSLIKAFKLAKLSLKIIDIHSLAVQRFQEFVGTREISQHFQLAPELDQRDFFAQFQGCLGLGLRVENEH